MQNNLPIWLNLYSTKLVFIVMWNASNAIQTEQNHSLKTRSLFYKNSRIKTNMLNRNQNILRSLHMLIRSENNIPFLSCRKFALDVSLPIILSRQNRAYHPIGSDLYYSTIYKHQAYVKYGSALHIYTYTQHSMYMFMPSV